MGLGNKGKQKINGWAITVIIALAYFFVPAFQSTVNNVFSGLGTGGGTGDTVVGTGSATGIECIYDGVTMTIGPMKKNFATTTSVTDEFARLFVNGADQGLKADGSTISVNFKDSVELYYAENSSTYYAAKHDFVVPCTSAFSTAEVADNDEHRLYQTDASTNLNIKIFNEDDGLLNTGTGGATGQNETLNAGDAVTLAGSFQGQFEDAYSPYGKILVTVKYNGSNYDEVRFLHDDAVADGVTPTFRSNANGTTGFTLKTWEMPGIISSELVHFSLWVDADDTNNPIQPGGQITIFLDDQDYFQHSKTGEMIIAAETDLDADVGDTATNAKAIYID